MYQILKLEELKYLPFNRPTKQSHINALAKSINKWGFQGVLRVVKTKLFSGIDEYYLADSQHTCKALLFLGYKEAMCSITTMENYSDIVSYVATLNTSSKVWNFRNFVEAFSYMIPSYKTILTFSEKYLISELVSSMILGEPSNVKSGKFEIARNNCEEEAKMLKEARLLTSTKKAWFDRAFIKFIRDIENYNHEYFMSVLLLNNKEFKIIPDNENDTVKLLKRLYIENKTINKVTA